MNYTSLEPLYRRRAQNKRARMHLIAAILVVAVTSYIATSWTLHTLFTTRSHAQQSSIRIYPTLPVSSTRLSDVVAVALKGSKGTYGIIIKNLKTDEIYHYNEHKIFEAGSLYKLWIMAAIYEQVEHAKLSLTDTLHADISKLNEQFHIATEDAELQEGDIDFTIEGALRQMITISHNYAALALSQRVKMSTVKAFLQEHGLQESFIGQPPKVSAYDIGVFFEKLYNHQLVSSTSDTAMLALLKEQALNHKLPGKLPEDVATAHKTGEIGMFTHDAGIVYSPEGDYIIVVLSLSDYPPGAEERIARLSKTVYDYFNE